MTEHDERPPEDAAQQARDESDPDLRPLPDGGLGENMPDWLRRPPAWRDLPVTLVAESRVIAPLVPAEKDATVAKRELPPQDTSIIDPKTLIEFDDLPAWLRELGASRSAASSLPESVDPRGAVTEPASEVGTDDATTLNVPHVDTKPVSVEVATVSEASDERDLAVWQRGPVIALLVVALLAAIGVAVLYATGVL
ncbi:MAG: hypothetical protein ACR2OE_12965 [Thermomicrobiales bacterium]